MVCVREGAAACHVNARDAERRVAQQSVPSSAHFLKLELFFMWLRHALKPNWTTESFVAPWWEDAYKLASWARDSEIAGTRESRD